MTAPDTTGAWTLPELIADRLSGIECVGERMVEIVAEPFENSVVVELAYVFNHHNHLRVTLTLGEPVGFDPATGVVDAEILGDGVEIGAST